MKIPTSIVVEDLGIRLDSQLTWKNHITTKINCVNPVIGATYTGLSDKIQIYLLKIKS